MVAVTTHAMIAVNLCLDRFSRFGDAATYRYIIDEDTGKLNTRNFIISRF